MQEKKEFDLLVKLMKIFDKDEANYELLIKDLSNKPWTMIVNKLKFNDFKEGEIYRIRGVYTE
jgi:ribosomal protein S1